MSFSLAIDCRMSGKSGIGAFIDSMLPTFIEDVCGNGGSLILLGLPQKKWEEFQATKITGIENCELLPCPIKNFSIKEMLFFPRVILKKINSYDAYFSPYCNIPGNIFTLSRKNIPQRVCVASLTANIATGITIPIFTTIHDIIFLDMPDMAGRLGTFLRKIIYKRAIRKSKQIFTVSNFSKSRIQEKLNCKKEITVVYSGVPILYEKTASSSSDALCAESAQVNNFNLRNRHEVSEQKQGEGRSGREKTNTIVFVGNIKKHKGIGTLIPAFIKFRESLEQTSTGRKTTTDRGTVEQATTVTTPLTGTGAPQPQLLIVGSKENFRIQDTALENLITSADQNGIVFTGFVPDQELKTLIEQARLLVQPSLYEGFGVPPLQALYSGTKAVISDIPVFKEIYASLPVTFFKAGDADDLAQKMREVYFDDAPLPKVERIYSYRNSAKIILETIK